MAKRSPSLSPAFLKAQAYACITTKSGTRKWLHYGELHRVDGPALIHSNGTQEWWLHGQRHRDGDLPAIIHRNGDKVWYKNGLCHRDKGPAVVLKDGTQFWYHNGIRDDAAYLRAQKSIKIRKLQPPRR